MKNIFYFLLLSLFTITSFAQTYNVKIYSGGEAVFSPTTAIDSITFESFLCGSKVLWGDELYPTVLIGSQCWFAKNLNVGTMINSTYPGGFQQTDNGIIEKYCYGNNAANCDTYGGLYEWNEAMQYSTTPGTRGICPPGWHIPTVAEFQTLSSSVGGDGNTLKAVGQGTGGGEGTNSSGFSALLAGSRYFDGGNFTALGLNAVFWSSTNAFNNFYLHSHLSNIDITSDGTPENGLSVRCVMD